MTFGSLISTLEAVGEPYHILPLESGWRVVATRRGARLFGPFGPGDDAPSLNWINPVWDDPVAFEAFINDGGWNLGGDRMWIAPEVQYNIHDRFNFWKTHNLPAMMDPGDYALTGEIDGLVWSQEIELTAYNTASGKTRLRIDRDVLPVNNPLHSDEIPEGVTYCGYRQTAVLEQTGGDDMLSENWSIVQLNPGGQLFIPVTGAGGGVAYFGDVPDEAHTPQDGLLRLNISGARQYKVGYRAVGVLGRMGYLHQIDTDFAYLLVRGFDNDPSATYSEEPPEQPGVNGLSVHVYNDDGGLGGFGEMECNGPAIGGDTGRTESTDMFTLWAYAGDPNGVRQVAYLLLGVPL